MFTGQGWAPPHSLQSVPSDSGSCVASSHGVTLHLLLAKNNLTVK